MKLLKSEHGVTHGFANLIALKALEGNAPTATSDDLVTAQYSGPKQNLRPIYDALIKAVNQFGKDVGCRSLAEEGLCQPPSEQAVRDRATVDENTC